MSLELQFINAQSRDVLRFSLCQIRMLWCIFPEEIHDPVLTNDIENKTNEKVLVPHSSV